MPKKNGIEVLEEIKREKTDVKVLIKIFDMWFFTVLSLILSEVAISLLNNPLATWVKVLILTVHTEIEYLIKALDIGVDGFILKDSESAEFLITYRKPIPRKSQLSSS